MVDDAGFDGSRALEMIQQQYTMDYGSRKEGARAAGKDDEYHPLFFLDMIILVGRPMQAITRVNDRFFDNVTITFRNWRSSYSCKHVYGLSFDLEQRTFRLATAASRESWFIVMHPIGAAVNELPEPRDRRRPKREQTSRSSALRPLHAEFLAGYIKSIFLLDELIGQGVEDSWVLDGLASQNMTLTKWTIFQQRFMEHWPAHVAAHGTDSFWLENLPAFHAYDYGANIEIDVNDYLHSLPQETPLRPPVEDSDDEDSEEGGTSATEDDMDSSDGSSSDQDSGPPGSTARMPASRRSRPTGRSPPRSEDEDADEGGNAIPPPISVDSYPAGLAQLHDELQCKYLIQNIGCISFALAIDINCLDTRSPEEDSPPARCLLADRNHVAREFGGARDFSFFPLAFHPAYGNFSSTRPPAFLTNHVLAVMKDNMSFRNGGTDPLSCGHFQGYSNIKRSIRHGPDDLLATKGIATAALTLPDSDVPGSGRLAMQRQKLRRQLMGDLTPNDPNASRPFAREGRRVEASLQGEEYAFRMEQVLAVHVGRLARPLRSFSAVLQPILHLMRFFLHEPERYSHLLRSF